MTRLALDVLSIITPPPTELTDQRPLSAGHAGELRRRPRLAIDDSIEPFRIRRGTNCCASLGLVLVKGSVCQNWRVGRGSSWAPHLEQRPVMGFNGTFQAQGQFEDNLPQLLAGVVIVLTRVLGGRLIKVFHQSAHFIFRVGRDHDCSGSNSRRCGDSAVPMIYLKGTALIAQIVYDAIDLLSSVVSPPYICLYVQSSA